MYVRFRRALVLYNRNIATFLLDSGYDLVIICIMLLYHFHFLFQSGTWRVPSALNLTEKYRNVGTN